MLCTNTFIIESLLRRHSCTRSPYYDTCRTLCPLSNYNETNLSPGPQNISIEISTSSKDYVEFDFVLSQETGFILTKDSEVNVTISPSKPWVMQYNMEKSLRAVRIEATSEDPGCMVLAIQDITPCSHDLWLGCSKSYLGICCRSESDHSHCSHDAYTIYKADHSLHRQTVYFGTREGKSDENLWK
ncbi:hypothetical protein AVEN_244163-1 [Araneus ventricosus]|uniref:Uncharacterized protein n=1 Tax=Araneus ventricosus TaxID=182803 RepID=A0A4Y2SUQ5_ARAVE|nr:hypothetical protein AVEN_244163-1 [Araneus ventricosus]